MRRSSSTRFKESGSGGFSPIWAPPKLSTPKGQMNSTEAARARAAMMGAIVPALPFAGAYDMELTEPDGSTSRITRDYAIYYDHWSVITNKACRCSAGLAKEYDDNGEYYIVPGNGECVGCYYHAKGKSSGISNRLTQSINIILMSDFHAIDSNNRNPRTGRPYKDYVPCKGRNCPHCKKGIEKFFGRRVYWPMGTRFATSLADYDSIDFANRCECGGVIAIVSMQCPECGEYPDDIRFDEMDKEEVTVIRDSVLTCKKCGYQGLFNEVPECDQCGDAKQMTVWSTEMKLYRSGEGTDTTLQKSDARVCAPERKERVKDLMQPFDVDRIKPLFDPDEQAKRLGVANPYVAAPVSGARSWEDDNDIPY